MISVRASVKTYGFDAGGDCPFGSRLADGLGGIMVAAGFEFAGQLFVLRRGRCQCFSRQIVDELHGNMLMTAHDAQARSIGRAANSFTNAKRATLPQTT